jgi:hypothetical protein
MLTREELKTCPNYWLYCRLRYLAKNFAEVEFGRSANLYRGDWPTRSADELDSLTQEVS